MYADQQHLDALWADVVAPQVQYLQAAIALQRLGQLPTRRSMRTRRSVQTKRSMQTRRSMRAKEVCRSEEVCRPEKARKPAAGGVVLEGKASLPG